jgi:dipeptidase E
VTNHGSEAAIPAQNPGLGPSRWAAGIGLPAYAIDEQTAIKVVDGSVELVSEGNGRR